MNDQNALSSSATPQQRRRKRNQAKKRREIQLRRQKILLFASVGLILAIILAKWVSASFETASDPMSLEENVNIALTANLSSEVMDYQDLIEQYAAKEGISGYVNLLLAIMQVESGGKGSDVMQSSESLNLPLNSLEPEESIAQACSYFSSLLEIAGSKGCDLDSVIQAYNYGPGYLTYVADNGGHHTLELAIEYANQQSGGSTVTYTNAIAVNYNGGWRYKYGNMFYVELVKEYISE